MIEQCGPLKKTYSIKAQLNHFIVVVCDKNVQNAAQQNFAQTVIAHDRVE